MMTTIGLGIGKPSVTMKMRTDRCYSIMIGEKEIGIALPVSHWLWPSFNDTQNDLIVVDEWIIRPAGVSDFSLDRRYQSIRAGLEWICSVSEV